MGQRFLIDTNIIIDALGNSMPALVQRKIERIPPIISTVTYIEVLGWHKITPDLMPPVQIFIKAATILPIDHIVVEKTILLRQQNKISLGDAIIAATAIVHNLTLVTRNVRDFRKIQELNLLNPWD